MAELFCVAQVFDDVVKVAEVLVGGFASFGAGEGYSGHNVGSTFGKVEEDAQESKVRICVHWLRCLGSGAYGWYYGVRVPGREARGG
jgi:hypothetical protein